MGLQPHRKTAVWLQLHSVDVLQSHAKERWSFSPRTYNGAVRLNERLAESGCESAVREKLTEGAREAGRGARSQ